MTTSVGACDGRISAPSSARAIATVAPATAPPSALRVTLPDSVAGACGPRWCACASLFVAALPLAVELVLVPA